MFSLVELVQSLDFWNHLYPDFTEYIPSLSKCQINLSSILKFRGIFFITSESFSGVALASRSVFQVPSGVIKLATLASWKSMFVHLGLKVFSLGSHGSLTIWMEAPFATLKRIPSLRKELLQCKLFHRYDVLLPKSGSSMPQ